MSQVEVRRKQFQSFSQMLGIVMLMIMGKRIGNNGIAYLAAAVEAMTLLLILLSEYVPEVLGRMLRVRKAKEQYRNANRIRSSVMIFQSLMGLVGMAVLLSGADVLARKVFLIPYSAFVIRLLAPVVLLRAMGSVLQGYFQGRGSQIPTVVVCVLRPLLTLALGLVSVPLFQGYGERASKLLLNDNIPSMYGAAGLAVAMIIAEVLLLLLLLVLYFVNRGNYHVERLEGGRRTESFGSAVGGLSSGLALLLAAGLLARIPVGLGLVFLQKKSADTVQSAVDFGAYYGGYLALCAFVILLCGIPMLPVAARTLSAIRRTETRYARDLCGIGLHLGLVYTLFPVAYFIALAAPLARAFEKGADELLAGFLPVGSFIIVEAVLAEFFLEILLKGGKALLGLASLGAGFVVFLVGVVMFVNVLDLGVAGLVYGGLLGGLVVCAMSGAILILQRSVQCDWLNWVIIPLGSAVLSGVVCLLIGKIFTDLLGDVGTLVIGLVVGLIFYLSPQLSLRSFRESELRVMVFGGVFKNLMGAMGISWNKRR